MYTIDTIFVFCVLLGMFLYPAFKYFNPKIEILQQENKYIIFLLYNKWEEEKNTFIRAKKHLFKLSAPQH